MTRKELFENIVKKQSFLCVGLDTDLKKMPKELLATEDPLFEFNKQIIDATKHLAVAYKINTAFYEVHGEKGWHSMRKTVEYIPQDIFTIADAKRGDIGNTSEMYAETFFNSFDFDAVTLSPYMGEDSIKPYLQYPGKWVIVLGLTSNPGYADVQLLKTGEGYVFEQVIKKVASWGNTDNTMFVVGATHPEMFKTVRAIVPNHFLLVPGIGAQGGDFEGTVDAGFNEVCGLLVNSSRGIIYASNNIDDFAAKATEAASQMQQDMQLALKKWGY